MIIEAIRITNFKGVISASFKPGEGLYVIGGENQAGKTSALDAIMVALGGKRFMPPEPVRDGAKEAEIRLDLSADPDAGLPALTVIRTIGTAGGGSLTVLEAGVKQSSPQAILDGLFGHLEKAGAFDPTTFVRLDQKAQVEQLQEIAGVNFDESDKERARLYGERTLVNREIVAAKAKLNELPEYHEGCKALVDASAIMDKMREWTRLNQDNADVRRERDDAVSKTTNAVCDLQAARMRLDEATKGLDNAEYALKERERERDALEATVSALVDRDTTALDEELATSEAANEKYRENKARGEAETALAEAQERERIFTATMDEIDGDKAATLQDADWPVEGLGFDESGVTYLGRPFRQASDSEQLRVAVAMGIAGNPTLRTLLLRRGESVGAKGMEWLAELAAKHNIQLIMERVGTEHANIVIEEGKTP